MTNQNSKYFKFQEKSDYIFYLAELITDLTQRIDKLKRYDKEIALILAENPKAKIIETVLFESISDKINRTFQYVFNLIGDESKKAVSYRKFRKILYKKRGFLNIEIDVLTIEESEILGEFNKIRNWGLHIPESLYLQKKEFFKMDSIFIEKYKTKIPIPQYDYYEIKYLTEIKREINEVADASIQILNRMKNDYSILIDGKLTIEYENNQVKPYLIMEVVQNSLDIQKGKINNK